MHEREAYLSSERAQKIDRQMEDAKSGHVVVEEQGDGEEDERIFFCPLLLMCTSEGNGE